MVLSQPQIVGTSRSGRRNREGGFDDGANVDQPFLGGDCYNGSPFTPISTYPCNDGSQNCLEGNEGSPSDMEKSMKPVWLVAAFLALVIAPLQSQERKEVTVTKLLSTTVTSSGQPIVLPQKDAQIVVSIYDVAPGARLPVHKHPYPATDMFCRGSCG
jgi:hypothetical protein